MIAADSGSNEGGGGAGVLSTKAQVANFIAGGLSGTAAGLIMMPLEVVKMQRQSSAIGAKNVGLLDICRKVMRDDGVRGFYKGALPSIIGVLPSRGLYFWGYNSSKEFHRARFGDTAVNHLLSAFTAGVVSNTCINPIWMVKTRYQLLADSSLGQKRYQSYRDCIRSIYQEEGARGFFKGLSASYIGCIEGAIQWIIYEKLKVAITKRYNDRNLNSINSNNNDSSSNSSHGSNNSISSNNSNSNKNYINSSSNSSSNINLALSASDYFFAAGFSKFIAICVSYPHEVVRTRMREQSSHGVFKYKGLLSTFKKIGMEEGVRGLYSGMWIHMVRSVPNSAIMILSFELISKWFQ